MLVCHYRGLKRGKIIDFGIAIWTVIINLPAFLFNKKLFLSHTELYFEKGRYKDKCFSSTMRDEQNGCRFKNSLDVIFKHPERWFISIVEMNEETEDAIGAWCEKQVGKKYDLFNVLFSFINPFIFDDPNKWYCSEVCYRALAKFKFIKLYKRISPLRGAYKMIQAGYPFMLLIDWLNYVKDETDGNRMA